MAKVPRNEENLLNTLKNELTLLSDFYEKAFIQGDLKYCGEVAGKLRLLVHDAGSNTPLLLRFMDRYQMNILLQFNQPWGKDILTLGEYLNDLACAIRVKDQLVEISNKKLVTTWAEQMGSAHQDWKIQEEFATALSLPLYIAEFPVAVQALRVVAKNVLYVGNEFIKILEDRNRAKIPPPPFNE